MGSSQEDEVVSSSAVVCDRKRRCRRIKESNEEGVRVRHKKLSVIFSEDASVFSRIERSSGGCEMMELQSYPLPVVFSDCGCSKRMISRGKYCIGGYGAFAD